MAIYGFPDWHYVQSSRSSAGPSSNFASLRASGTAKLSRGSPVFPAWHYAAGACRQAPDRGGQEDTWALWLARHAGKNQAHRWQADRVERTGRRAEVELSIPAARAYTAPSEGQAMRLTDKIFAKLSGRGTAKKS